QASPNVGSVRRVEVPICGTHHPQMRREGASTQRLVRSEPGARVLLVGIFGKAGIGEKVARGPLPDAAEHLIASAMAGGDFPFEFSRQASAGPAAIGVGLEPGDVRDRPVWLQSNPFGEVAAPPSPVLVALPVDRR